jgi:hypothetical protein
LALEAYQHALKWMFVGGFLSLARPIFERVLDFRDSQAQRPKGRLFGSKRGRANA